MARIKDTSVEQVKATVDIVAVVSGRTALRKAGGRFVGRCPFHEERTPSFSVSPEKGYYHCFGCGKGGDAIRFVQEAESLDFVGAIEWLADRFSIQLEYEEASPEVEARRQRAKRMQELLEAAAAFYERYLWDSPAGGPARDYLKSRALGEQVCRELGLGLALGGTTLARKALERGFTAADLTAAGLANRRGNDFFSGRLMFPLADARGRIVGFQARKLREDDPLRAKYVNSPESEQFRKGSILYGLHLARTAIAKEGRALVVEGNTDVLALRQAGVMTVVASMGTALTEQQVRELARLTRRVYLCFDGDAAGEAATLRGMEIATEAGLDVHVVALPPGFDPADVAEGFEDRLGTAESYLGYRVRLELERAPDRQEAFVRAREVIGRFEDSPERQAALRMIAGRLDLPKETLAGFGSISQPQAGPTVSPKLLELGERLERDALAGAIAHPRLLPILRELGPEHFDSELHRRTCAHLLGAHAVVDDDLIPVLAELDARAASEGITEETAEQLLLRLRERRLRRELETADDERLPELQQALAKVRTAFRQFA